MLEYGPYPDEISFNAAIKACGGQVLMPCMEEFEHFSKNEPISVTPCHAAHVSLLFYHFLIHLEDELTGSVPSELRCSTICFASAALTTVPCFSRCVENSVCNGHLEKAGETELHYASLKI